MPSAAPFHPSPHTPIYLSVAWGWRGVGASTVYLGNRCAAGMVKKSVQENRAGEDHISPSNTAAKK